MPTGSGVALRVGLEWPPNGRGATTGGTGATGSLTEADALAGASVEADDGMDGAAADGEAGIVGVALAGATASSETGSSTATDEVPVGAVLAPGDGFGGLRKMARSKTAPQMTELKTSATATSRRLFGSRIPDACGGSTGPVVEARSTLKPTPDGGVGTACPNHGLIPVGVTAVVTESILNRTSGSDG